MQVDVKGKGGWTLEFNLLRADNEMFIRIVSPEGEIVDRIIEPVDTFTRAMELVKCA